ncbi:hypothetical protein OG474_00200 [Kribbella sp. NBC_01505]|uniref:hypothetical protein n=1 Tax=Kribbella sp. NBC_01505 TaxID=2903580 RepID=UPI00386A703F
MATSVDTNRLTSSAERADRLRRRGLAAGAFTGPVGLLIANALYAYATKDGGSDATGAETLALIVAHPTATRFATLAAALGSLLMVPAVLAAIRVIGSGRSAKLGFIGGTLAAGGYICYFGVNLAGLIALSMAKYGGPTADFAAVIDDSQGGDPAFAWVFPLFILGNLVGIFLLGLALLRSRTVPVLAAAGVMSWPPLHILGLFVLGNEYPEVVGGAFLVVAFGVIGVRLLRGR